MAKTVGFGKLEREMLSNDRLPPDVRVAIVEYKNEIKRGELGRTFKNKEQLLPEAAVGQTYHEKYVGKAHEGDDEPAGKRRLVALLDPTGRILRMYFSDDHYTRSVWKELQYP